MSARKKSAATDRRLARSAATRGRVVEALLALIDRGDLRPTAPRIAAEAGVSLRSVFQHYADLETLFAAAADRQTERLQPLLARLDAGRPLAARVDVLVAQRARLFEAIAPVRRAALLMEPFSAEVAARLGTMRAWQRAELARLFARELARHSPAERRARLAALAALCGFSSWQVLRRHQGLSAAAARRVLQRAIAALLR